MSKLAAALWLSNRYLRPKRTFVSIITRTAIVGVGLGVAGRIIVISVMSGFDHDLRQKILGFNAHLTITQTGTAMTHYRDVEAIIAKNNEVKGVSPFVLGPVMAVT